MQRRLAQEKSTEQQMLHSFSTNCVHSSEGARKDHGNRSKSRSYLTHDPNKE